MRESEREGEKERESEREINEILIEATVHGRISEPSRCLHFRRISDTRENFTRFFIPSWPDSETLTFAFNDAQSMMGVKATVLHAYLLKWYDMEIRLKDSQYIP